MGTYGNETMVKDPAERVQQRPAVTPRVDVFENENEYLLLAELPGVDKQALDIRLQDGELTIEAKRATPELGALLAVEYRPADYIRKFAIPSGVDPNQIEAALDGGVLRLRLPKAEDTKPRQIPIHSA